MAEEKRYPIILVYVGTALRYEYMGRPSVLGNPLQLSPSVTRDEACDYYETYFANKIENEDPIFLRELARLHHIGVKDGVLRLGCYCAPKRCHCDTIKSFLEKNYDGFEMF